MIRGQWTFRLAPREDELLSSLLVRNACAHGSAPYIFTNMFWPGRPVWTRDPDRLADPGWLEEVAAHLGTTAERVAGTTLGALHHADRPAVRLRRGDLPLILSASVYHRLRRRHALQFCPQCLAEEDRPHFVRAWRMGFVFTCPAHGTPLLDSCPRCDACLTPHRAAPEYWRCHGCGDSLATASGEGAPDAPPAVMRLERALLSVVREGTATDPIGPWRSTDAITGVRTLIAVAGARWLYGKLRQGFRLAPAPVEPGEEVQFEHARRTQRLALMEIVVRMLESWPDGFRDAAHLSGMTRTTFDRYRCPPELQKEVDRLPAGQRRRRTGFVQVLASRRLARLRRRDPVAYRIARADLLLAACGRPTSACSLDPRGSASLAKPRRE